MSSGNAVRCLLDTFYFSSRVAEIGKGPILKDYCTLNTDRFCRMLWNNLKNIWMYQWEFRKSY